MRFGDAFGATAALGAALFAAAASGAAAQSACSVSAASIEATIAGVTAAGTLLADGGLELVPAGIALRPIPGTEDEADTTLAAALGRFAPATVGVAPTGVADRYGRTHGHVFLAGGRWLQAEWISAGLAIARPEGEDMRCDAALLSLEAGARRRGNGLWADSKIPLKASDRPSLLAESGLYGVVEGRVVSVGYGTRMVFLDFGRDFRADFTVMVPNPLIPRLLEAGIALDSLAGRAVRVRGVIEESGGPAIRLANPLDLELLAREE